MHLKQKSLVQKPGPPQVGGAGVVEKTCWLSAIVSSGVTDAADEELEIGSKDNEGNGGSGGNGGNDARLKDGGGDCRLKRSIVFASAVLGVVKTPAVIVVVADGAVAVECDEELNIPNELN